MKLPYQQTAKLKRYEVRVVNDRLEKKIDYQQYTNGRVLMSPQYDPEAPHSTPVTEFRLDMKKVSIRCEAKT